MKRFALASFFIFALLFPSSVSAALVVIEDNGTLHTNVLSAEDQRGAKKQSLQIVSLPPTIESPIDASVSLVRNGDKLQLEIASAQGTTKADVSSYGDELIEIKQQDVAKTLIISSEGENFVIKQEGIVAKTIFPITINAKNKAVQVATPSGDRFVEIYPSDAFVSSVNANFIDTLVDSSVQLTENEKGELQYQLVGEKNIDLFNIIKFTAPVTISVSASNGKVLHTEAPLWLKIFGFLLV